MNQQPTSFVTVDLEDNYQCPGCSYPNDVFSDVESDGEDLPHQLLDRFLDKSRSVKRQEVTGRPCYHGRLETPIIAFNVAILSLSSDLLDKIEHIPKTIVFTEKCTPEDFYKTVGCSRDTKEVLTNLIVFKFTPEDIEDESLTDNLYKHLVEHKSFASSKLKCDLFSKLYALPLPKENEPPVFLPITSRLNLESCPRDENILLGVIVRKPPLEEGELEGESNQTPVEVDSSNISEILSPDLTDAPPSSSKPAPLSPNSNLSPSTLAKIKSGLDSTFKLMPADRYGSYIGAPTEDIPFLTDPVTSLRSVVPSSTTKKPPTPSKYNRIESITRKNNLLDDISDCSVDDDDDNLLESANKLPSSRKRTSTTSLCDHKPSQIKQQRASSSTSSSSSMPNLSSSLLSTAKHKTPSSQVKPNVNISKTPASANTSLKKQKVSNNNDNNTDNNKKAVIDLDSSESDPNDDLFPRQPNMKMIGTLTTTCGGFAFKYHVIHTDRSDVKKYFPTSLTIKGRARALDCEQCLLIAKQKPNVKIILFQILPRETAEDRRVFENFATHLLARDRYALINYQPTSYRAYILPYVKDTRLMQAFKILGLKPRDKYKAELYGLIIKKSAMIPPNDPRTNPLPSNSSDQSTRSQSTSSSVTNKKEANAIESSEFHNTNLKAKYGNEKFPQLDVFKLANLIHSSVDDLINLSFKVSNILQKTTENASELSKAEATAEFQSKVIFIMGLEEQQHAKRRKAYDTILSWLKTLR